MYSQNRYPSPGLTIDRTLAFSLDNAATIAEDSAKSGACNFRMD